MISAASALKWRAKEAGHASGGRRWRRRTTEWPSGPSPRSCAMPVGGRSRPGPRRTTSTTGTPAVPPAGTPSGPWGPWPQPGRPRRRRLRRGPAGGPAQGPADEESHERPGDRLAGPWHPEPRARLRPRGRRHGSRRHGLRGRRPQRHPPQPREGRRQRDGDGGADHGMHQRRMGPFVGLAVAERHDTLVFRAAMSGGGRMEAGPCASRQTLQHLR